MGISRLDAAVIQTRGDDVKCEAGGPSTDPETKGKYVGWVMLYNNGEYDHPLVSTKPIFDSAEAAIAKMEELVAEIRAMPSVIDEILPMLGEDAEPIFEVVGKAREIAGRVRAKIES